MKKLISIFFAAMAGWAGQGLADDVEIYFSSGAGSTGAPLVMFALDYRPNLGSVVCNVTNAAIVGEEIDDEPAFIPDFSACDWTADFAIFNTFFETKEVEDGSVHFFDLLRAALRMVLSDPQLMASGMQLGLLLNHDDINGCAGPEHAEPGCSNGGYIGLGLTPVPAGADALNAKLLSIPTPQGEQSHKYQGKELYFELFRYLTGQPIFNGHNGFVDYADPCPDDNLDDTNPETCAQDEDLPEAAWDASVEDGSNYVSPLADINLQCSSAHVLNFMFGAQNSADDSDDAIEEAPGSGGLGFRMSGGSNEQFSQVLEKLRNTDLADGQWGNATDLDGNQNVTSHFLHNGNRENTINGWAAAGGGRSIEVSNDPRVVVDELKNTFLTIIRQNSTFEAPAVTVNSYNRLAHRDEVFYALFGPENVPDWPGNLKKYQFTEVDLDLDDDGITDTTQVVIVDSRLQPAIDADGLFDPGACSFWSNCTLENDGDDVKKGGAAQKLNPEENPELRNVYTYTGASVNPASPITLSSSPDYRVHEVNSLITNEMLGLTDEAGEAIVGDYNSSGAVDDTDLAAARLAVLRIGRGVSEFDETLAINEMGDPIHSRPSVIIYDGDVNDADNDGIIEPDFAIAVSTNEGYFHLIDAQTGQEVFSFIPKEMLPLLWKINKEPTASTGDQRFDTYGLDASPVVLWKDVNGDDVITSADGDRVVVFLAQRRGGRNLYALDITVPTAPRLLWHIEGGASGFEELGQTWSEPTLTKVQESDGSLTDVLVFGGGYDEDRYDDMGGAANAENIGRAVFVVEALTGTTRFSVGPAGTDETYSLELASLQDSVPAQVRVLDLYDDGIMDRIYFNDIVGRIFRVDFNSSGSSTTLHGGGLVATLTNTTGCNWNASPNACRRFYNSLDVAVMTGFPVAPYIQLAMGSGYRAHPKDDSTQDRFYVVYDQAVVDLLATSDYATRYGANGFTEANDLANVTDIAANTTYAEEESALTAILTASDVHGWYLDMDQTIGEKVISESLTIGGQLVFTTYIPSTVATANACSTGLGNGRVYLINAFNGLPEASLGDGVVTLLQTTDEVTETQRYKLLPREGMPTDPTIVFKEKDDGTIDPTLVVGTQLPMPSGLIKAKPIRRTWWREE